MRTILITATVLSGLFLAACNTKEKDLQQQLISMQQQMESNQSAMESLYQIQRLMDEIELQQAQFDKEMKASMAAEDYVQRMELIKSQMKLSQSKISNLENQLAKSDQLKNSFEGNLKKIKNELKNKENEFLAMQKLYEEGKKDNQQMAHQLKEQQQSLESMKLAVETSKNELIFLEKQIAVLKRDNQVSEADGFYARGVALEEVAKRTQLSPKKKKAAYQEAYSYYLKAHDLGKPEAKDKLNELKKKAHV